MTQKYNFQARNALKTNLQLRFAHLLQCFFALLTISLGACAAAPTEIDLKVQFVNAQTLKPLNDVFVGVMWMENRTDKCLKHALQQTDSNGRVHFKRVSGAWRMPLQAMGLDLQMINREYDEKSGRYFHRLKMQRHGVAKSHQWEKMLLDLGYEKIDRSEYSEIEYVLWLPANKAKYENGFEPVYMLSARATPFDASQYYTRIYGPCVYRQYDAKTAKVTETVDQSEYSDEMLSALNRTKALAQYQLLCDARWEGVFLGYQMSQFVETFALVDKPENSAKVWEKFRSVVPTYKGKYPDYPGFTTEERQQFCGWIAGEIQK